MGEEELADLKTLWPEIGVEPCGELVVAHGPLRCGSAKVCVILSMSEEAGYAGGRTGHSSLGRGHRRRSASILPLHCFRSVTRGSASVSRSGRAAL